MISHLLDRCIAEFILLHHLSTKIQPPPLFSSLRIRQDDRARSNALFIKMEETTAQKLLQIHSLESLPTYWKTHTFKEINTWRNYTHTHTHTAAVSDSSLSSCCCCYLESHLSCHWSLLGPPPLPRSGRPSPPGSRRSALSASSCGPWCSASSSSSSAGRWRWPCGSSAWLRTPASAACSSCVEPAFGGRESSHSPCGTADASVRSAVHGCPGPCGGAAPGSPGMDTGWARTDSSCCGSTAPRGGRSLHNHGSHSYTEARHRYTHKNLSKCTSVLLHR